MRKTKTILSVLLTAAMLLTMFTAVPFSVSAAGNTWNPSAGVYDISTEDDLFAFRDELNNDNDFSGKEINLLNDIEISAGATYESSYSRVYGYAYFFGTFNGNNHTISNLNMVSSDDTTVSFLPILGDATIRDLTLKDVTIENGKTYNAAFAAMSMGDDKIINCHLTGNCLIKSDENLNNSYNYTAGIIAQNYSGTLYIKDCSVGEDVTIIGTTNAAANRSAAGILAFIRVANNNNTLVSNCVNRADVESSYVASGIVGIANSDVSKCNSLTIEDCVNYGDIASPSLSNGTKWIAGILSKSLNWSTVYIDRCANHGDITVNGSCSSGSGGIAGEVACCSIQNTYNTGNVTALNANILGGIVGQFRTAQTVNPVYAGGTEIIYNPEQYNSMINCYNTGNIIGGNTEFVSGLCGVLQDTISSSEHSIIVNAYNFGNISGGLKTGNICAEVQNSSLYNTFSPNGTHCIQRISKTSGNVDSTSNIGYFTSANTDGIIYPATMTTNQSEMISSEPLNDNLLKTLNKWVSNKNAELEADGNEYRYLTWKMTKPASEDGSKGVTVHPMFGVEVLQTLSFHVNEPEKSDKLFRVYNGDASEAEDTTEYTFTNDTVKAFYDIPAFANDDYVFAGWYYDTDGTSDGDIPFEFDSEIPANLSDVYAHWIPVGTVSKDGEDDKELPDNMNSEYSGFGLFGVQIRPEAQFDQNMGEYYYGGLRFISSISESLLSDIDDLSTEKVGSNNVEYGYVTAAKSTIDTVADNADMHIDKSKYKIQYKGENVNGVDTLLNNATSEERKTPNNFRYVTNVDCTSKYDSGNGKVYGNNPRVKIDHKNFSGYRLMTFVVNYTGENAESDKGKDVVARAYIRYYDANGLLRTFYNDYGGTNVYGGCSTSFNTVKNAITGDIKTEVKK